MAPRNIPGYYFDPEKKKFFKIEDHAPPTASYSAESVKRRKIEDAKKRKAQRIAAHKRTLIQRSRALQDPMIGGFLAVEFGSPPIDLQVDCWAKGLCYKGHVPIVSRSPSPGLTIDHLYISASDTKTGLGVAIGSGGGGYVFGAYVPRDEHDRVVWREDSTAPLRLQGGGIRQGNVPQLSCLRYHQQSDRLLMTSRTPGREGGLYSWHPVSSRPDPSNLGWDSKWDLAQSAMQDLQHLHSFAGKYHGVVANACAPAPAAASNLVCVVGTSHGLGSFSTSGQMLWLDPSAAAARRQANASSSSAPPSSDILSVDFLPGSPHVVAAGVRGSRRILLADLRQKPQDWEWIVHRSSPAHVRCLDEHRVLAAGPNNSMSIYDIRFRRSCRGREGTLRNTPVVTFPEYKNAEDIHFGLDVDTSLGVVATGDPSAVAAGRQVVNIFSLKTGRKLAVPALANPRSARDPDPGAEALMFQTMPGEINASLFVGGESGQILKYSFGGDIDEWTGERYDPPR